MPKVSRRSAMRTVQRLFGSEDENPDTPRPAKEGAGLKGAFVGADVEQSVDHVVIDREGTEIVEINASAQAHIDLGPLGGFLARLIAGATGKRQVDSDGGILYERVEAKLLNRIFRPPTGRRKLERTPLGFTGGAHAQVGTEVHEYTREE